MISEVTQAALEPCPFCGSGKIATYDGFAEFEGEADWAAFCNMCEATVCRNTEAEAITAWNTRLTAQSGEGRSGAGEDAVAVGLTEQVAEAMEDDGGEWRSCTGCHETNEGYSTGHFAYSAALKCELGSGCRECGGIGAVWDDTDYADMADFMAAADRDHANIKRILIENDIQPYRAEQIAMAITELEIPAALNARQSGEGEREALRGLEWTEDGYSLRTPYDGDVDGDGRHIIVGGETILTFDDSEVADGYRLALDAALRATDDAGGAK